MRLRKPKHAGRRQRRAIRTKTDPWQGDFLPHVGFVHQEVDGVHPAVVFDHQIDGRFLRRSASLPGDFGQRFSGQVLQRLVLESGQQHLVGRAGGQEQILPIVRGSFHLPYDAPPRSRIAQPLTPDCLRPG